VTKTLQTLAVTQQTITATSDELVDHIQEQQSTDPLTGKTILDLAVGKTKLKEVALGLCAMHIKLLTYDGHIWILKNTKLRLKLIKHVYDDITAGHPGCKKTLELLTRNYYFPGIRKFVN
jgi:hypothetical protein